MMAIRLIESATPLRNSAICLGLKTLRLGGAQIIGVNCDESALGLAAVARLGAEESIRHARMRHQCPFNLVHRPCRHGNLPRAGGKQRTPEHTESAPRARSIPTRAAELAKMPPTISRISRARPVKQP